MWVAWSHRDRSEDKVRPVAAASRKTKARGTAADPLIALFAEYRQQVDWMQANGADESTPEFKAMDAKNRATMERMHHEAPAPTTLAGVALAIRYAVDEDCLIDHTAMGPLKAALAFLNEQINEVC